MKKIVVVLGQFHTQHVQEMLLIVREEAQKRGLYIADEVWVPGSMEKPLALKLSLEKEEIAGAVVLGIIESGETQHGVVMAHAVIGAIIDLQIATNKPIGVGILGPGIYASQIESRLAPYAMDAIEALSCMLKLIDRIRNAE